MAEELEIPVQTPEQQEQIQEPTEFAKDFDRFWGKPEEKTEVPQETVSGGNNTPEISTTEPDWVKLFEEKTGGKVKGWEDVNALLNRQPEVLQPQFANDTTKSIYEAMVNGKEDEVEAYFIKRNIVKSLKEKPADVVVKAHIREQYPLFNEQETDYFFNQNYGFDETQFEDNDIGLSVAKKSAQQKLERASSEALTYFTSKAEEIQLPKFDTPKQPPVQEVDLNTETAKQVAAFVKSRSSEYVVGNEIPYKYSNKENSANVEGKVTLDESVISEYEKNVEKPELIFANRYFANGEYDSKKFARDQYILDNLPKLLQAAAGDMYNKGFADKVMQDKNIRIDKQGAAGGQPEVSDARAKAEDYKYRGFSEEAILKITGIDLR